MTTYFENLPLEVLHPLFLFSELEDYPTVSKIISRLRNSQRWEKIFNQFDQLKIFTRKDEENFDQLIFSLSSKELFEDLRLTDNHYNYYQFNYSYFIYRALIDNNEKLILSLKEYIDNQEISLTEIHNYFFSGYERENFELPSINLNLLFLLEWPYNNCYSYANFIVDLLRHPNIDRDKSENICLDSNKVSPEDVASYVEEIISRTYHTRDRRSNGYSDFIAWVCMINGVVEHTGFNIEIKNNILRVNYCRV